MIVGNIKVFTEEAGFVYGAVKIEEDRIKDIYLHQIAPKESQESYVNGGGNYLIPGMIDIHLHGCKGDDFCDGTLEAVERIAEYQASIGVTTMGAATMTLSLETLEKVLAICALYHKKKALGEYTACADLAGINMEGPFISEIQKGAQNINYIRRPEKRIFCEFQKAAAGLIKYVGVAPEREGALEFIDAVKEKVKVSLAHSNADYARAKKAFRAGATHVTHLYNGMRHYHHREPGIIGAVFDSEEVEAELICDGIHVHPAVIAATFRMLGKERIILISDSIRATGMETGEYELGEQKIIVKQGRAVVSGTDTIAGAIATLPEAFRYAVKNVGIPLEDAVLCVTKNPAVSLGIYNECGSVSVGKRADLVLLDEDLKVTGVIKSGQLLNWGKCKKTFK